MIRHISGRLRAQRICRLGLLAAAITSLGVFTNGQITLAAGVTRTPSGTSGNWSATGSWTSGLVPLNSPGDTVLYNNLASSSLTLDTNVTVGTLNLSSAINWSITGSTNTLTMDWTGGLSNPLSTSNAFIGVSGNGTLSLAPRINIANTQLDIGSVSGTTGTVTLTGAVGGTGNLNLKANGSGAISLAAINMTGALTNIGSGSGTVTISGVIGNNLTALTQSSSTSKLILNALNTYTGLTTVTAGTLQIGDNTLAGSLGGDLLNNSATAVSWVTNNNSGNQSYGGSIHGTGGFAKSGTTGSLTLTGVSTYAGGTTLTAGLLVIGNAQALGSTNGSLSLGTSAASNVLDLHGYSISVGALTSSAGVGQISNNQTGSSSTLILGNGNTTGTYNGVIVDHTSGTGTLTLTKTGSGTQTFSGTNAYSGGTLVAGGTLTISANSLSGNGALTVTSSGGSAFGTATLSSTVPGNSSPFGTGALTLNGGTINLAPTGSGNSISYSGISQVPGTQLSFSGTSTIALLKGSQTSLAFTAGNAADTGNVLNRTAHGVLLLKPSAAANLGTTEKFLLNGTAPAVSNGMVSPWIVGQNTNATTNFYDFLTYGSNGFVVTTNYASHTSSFITGNNEIANVILSAAGSITDNGAHPYAVVVNVSASNPAPSVINPLQIGSGGIILNSSVNNPTFLTAGAGGALAFGATEGLIYLNSTGGGTGGSGLAVPLTGSGGITLSGNTIGTSLASSGNTYTGGLTINKGVILNGGTDNYFGDISNTVTLNGGGLMSVSDTSYSSARAINLGATGGYINSGNRSTSFAGNISGVGALQVGGTNNFPVVVLSGRNTYTGGTILTSQAELIVASDANIGGASSALTFNNGILGVPAGSSWTSFGSHQVSFFSNTGIDVQNPNTTFTINQSLNQGSGSFSKYGAGTVLLSGPNYYTGATGVYGGTLKVDASQGASLATTAPTLGGGTLWLLGKSSGVTTTTLGNVTLNQGGGTIKIDTNGGSKYTLALGTLASGTTNGSALNIVTAGTGTVAISTTSAKDTYGIFGGRITFNGSDWATTLTGSSPYTFGALPAGAYSPLTSGGYTDSLNSLITGNLYLTGTTTTTNSVKITTTAAGQSLTLASSLVTTSGGLLFTGANDYTITGGYLMAGLDGNPTNPDLIIHTYGTGKLTINSNVRPGMTGAPTLTKTGPGTLVLTSALGNMYTGTTYVNGGVLSISANNLLGTQTYGASVFLNGGTLQATSTFGLFYGSAGTNNRNIILGSGGGTIDVVGGNTLTIAGNVVALPNSGNSQSGAAALTITSSDNSNSTLVLSGTGQFDGGVNINGGTLRLGSASALTAVGTNTLALSGTGKLQLNGNSVTLTSLLSSSTDAVVENGNNTSTAATLTINNGADNTYAGTLQNGNATGALALTKGGCGVLTLTGNNTYTGPTSIQNGAISVSSLGKVSSSISLGYGASSGALVYTGSGETTARNINLAGLSGGGILDQSGTGLLKFTSNLTANPSLSSALAGAGDKSLVLQGSTAGTGEIAGTIADSSGGATGVTSLVKTGSGTWVLSGANTYSGDTLVQMGRLVVGSTGSISQTRSIQVSGGATLEYAGTTPLALAPTLAEGSTFIYNSSAQLASALTIPLGQTLGGSGTLGTVNLNGTLSPGNSPGTITVDALVMGSSSLTHMEIGGAVTGQYDNVTVTNSSSLTYGGTLEIISYGTYNVASQDGTYGLFSFTGGYNGELAAVTVDGFALSNQSGIWVGELEGAIYRFDDSTGTLAVMVPEPTALVIGMGALGLLARRKRSRR